MSVEALAYYPKERWWSDAEIFELANNICRENDLPPVGDILEGIETLEEWDEAFFTSKRRVPTPEQSQPYFYFTVRGFGEGGGR